MTEDKGLLDKIGTASKTVATAAGQYVRQKQKEIEKLVNPDEPEKRIVQITSSEELSEMMHLYTAFSYINAKLECLKIKSSLAENKNEVLNELAQIEKMLDEIRP